jgi:Bacterial Ig domain/RTX calcium-binding nonapeptide repeat (4 copies)
MPSQQASLKHHHLPIDAGDVFEEIIQQIYLQYKYRICVSMHLSENIAIYYKEKQMTLAVNYTFKGNGNWSLDATSGSATDGGVIEAIVPINSHIEAAFLYATTYSTESSAGSVDFDGTTLLATDFTALGVTSASSLQAFRADVTDLVSADVGDGSNAPFSFEISNVASGNVDGYALAVIYSNPDEANRSIIFADGSSEPAGDAFTVNFPTPIDTTVDDFSALLSLGIGFGFQFDSQFSTVDVDGRRLTSFAGGQDDGIDTNGGLITIGGLGDDPANPVDPFGSEFDPRYDDELYDLAQGDGGNPVPFLANGATSISVATTNPSNNDNIFFAGFNILGDAIVDSPVNDTPTAVNDDVATLANSAIPSIALLANDIDPDGDPLSIVELGGVAAVAGTPIDLASGAQVTLNADGTVAYNQDDAFPALAAGVEAVDSFTYTISDGQGGTDTATVQVTVTGVEAEEDDCDCGDSVLGTEGADNMRGTTADDSICGLDGDDTITGFMGNDKLMGGSGDDHLNGGIGNDTLKGGIGEDSLNGGIGDDMLNGGEDNDDLQGGNGVDTLLGGNGDDTMNGGNDADVLQGGIGNDVMTGGTGEDRLEGGEGDDTLTGGTGADTFVFKPGFGNDTITSFQIAGAGHDFLEFDSGIFADTAALFAHSADTADGVLVTTDAADTLLIKSASLAQLQAHPEDFHFV